MNANRDPEAILAAWLDEGPLDLPDVTRRAILTSLPTTPQARRSPVAPWRFPMLQTQARVLVLLGVVAAVVVAGVLVLGGVGNPAPSPTTTTPPSVTDAPTLPPSLAPFGYGGGGTIEYTNHDAAGNDVLWVIDPSGANPTALVQGGCCGLFSPDGSQLALGLAGVKPADTTRDPTLEGIEVLDSPGTRVAFVVPTGCVSCDLLGLNYAPDAWSPNGRYIAYDIWSDTDPGKAGMGIADRDFKPFAWGSALIRVTGAHADIPLAFSPDSSMLLFLRTDQTVGPTSIGPLFLLRLSDLSVGRISPVGGTVQTNGLIQSPASWSPDGQTIVFAGTDAAGGRSGIFAVSPATGSSIRTLIADAPGATWARFSPDGSLIAFDQRPGAAPVHDLYVIHPEGSGLTNLTATFEPGVCCAQWSPDGRAMVVAGTTSDDSHNNLFVVTADGTGIWQVTNDENAYSAFLWGSGFR